MQTMPVSKQPVKLKKHLKLAQEQSESLVIVSGDIELNSSIATSIANAKIRVNGWSAEVFNGKKTLFVNQRTFDFINDEWRS